MTPADSIEDYTRKIERLTRLATDELRSAHGSGDAMRTVCCRYFRRGYVEKFTTGELVDFFGVSGTVCRDAGFTDQEADEVMRLIGALTDEEIASTQI
jgi:hypothetical protein